MSRTSAFTTVTPLPAGITRKHVMELYHDHAEMIRLNPLVIDHTMRDAPEYAPTEEHEFTWYTIKDKISYLPGGLLTSTLSYNASFKDHPDSLQTHVYAPMGLDIRARWSVGGRLPGESEEPGGPKEPHDTQEQPSNPAVQGEIPSHGLYIREEVEMKCNFLLLAFTKKTFKETHKTFADRLVELVQKRESSKGVGSA